MTGVVGHNPSHKLSMTAPGRGTRFRDFRVWSKTNTKLVLEKSRVWSDSTDSLEKPKKTWSETKDSLGMSEEEVRSSLRLALTSPFC